jgi:uncharacterized protein (TIGR02001 family)
MAASWATPARAEVGATVSAFSDLRFRGISLSEGRPVGIFDFAYDSSSGFYADAAASGVLRSGGEPEPLGIQLSAGYARRLKSGTTIDFGMTQSSYTRYSNGQRNRAYTEVYAGLARGDFSSRVFLSPHYSVAGRWTAYGEVNGDFSLATDWSLNTHVGTLMPLRTPTGQNYRVDFDWSIGVTRTFGPVSLHVAWSDGGPGKDHYGGRVHGRSALVLGASWAL